MIKKSTLFYSIHNLASQLQHNIVEGDDLDLKNIYPEVYEMLNTAPLVDVNQQVVENILDFYDKNY